MPYLNVKILPLSCAKMLVLCQFILVKGSIFDILVIMSNSEKLKYFIKVLVHFCLTSKDFFICQKAFILGIFKAVRINPLKNIHFSDKVGGGGSLLSEPDRSITASPRLWLKTCHWQLFLTRRPTQSNHLKP